MAFLIRVVGLGYPNKLIFDETYYAKDGWTLWKSGYERQWPADTANDSVVAGNPNVYLDSPAFIVHPPVGKWLIGLGEQLFGMNSFGWRVMPLVFGTLLVFITIRLARRLSRSTLIGGIAGILLTLDGLAFVMSRIALLDIFQAFFLVAAVSCCVADRDWYRHRLADRLDSLGRADFGGEFGPVVWLRPWRLAAGVLFGLAIGTKWNSVYVLAAFGIV
ncbi:MAG: phospholipid carrier-dependent glycosyltransferase, partial [Propionicimonas sp.]|nr:phospholipid carrier-dependent glycosyltransferase [Propionicimonas sp.]